MRERKGEVDLKEEEEVEDEDEPWGQDAVSRVPETVFTSHGRTLRITASMVAVRDGRGRLTDEAVRSAGAGRAGE
jgi:hypothetical protein